MKTLVLILFIIFPQSALAVDYFVSTSVECEAYATKMNTLHGYPNPATKTEDYGKCKQHNSRASNYYVIIKSVWSPKLNRQMTISDIDGASTAGEKNKRRSRSNLIQENAFPSGAIN